MVFLNAHNGNIAEVISSVRNRMISFSLLVFTGTGAIAQLDYDLMENWAFHPSKTGTLLDGYNLDIAVIDESLNTDTVFEITNNSMTNTGVDVFYVHPTILTDITEYTTRENIHLSDQPTFLIYASILGQAGLLSKYGRFFAPRYRQATPPTYLGSPSDSTQAAVIGEAYKDVKASFLHYLENYNSGNHIILASHSQGTFMAAMLVRDVFDDAPDLQNKLVVAVLAGTVSTYAEPFQFTGGWWQNIPFCTAMDQCGCVMTWRSFKEGQSLPAPNASLPCNNHHLVDSNRVYRLLNVNQDWIIQDSIYYSTTSAPLRYYLTPKTNQPYGGDVGFIAFDSLYHISYQRDDLTRVGFMVEYTPKPNEQRPNYLLEEESNPLFNSMGYHSKDYNIYHWALMEQIDTKLEACGIMTGLSNPLHKNNVVRIFPNPGKDFLSLDSEKKVSRVEFYDVHGQHIKSVDVQNREISIPTGELPSGVYFVKAVLSNGNTRAQKWIKE